MKIIFFGTPKYVLPILSGLHKEFRDGNRSPIVAVVTQAPKPIGRSQKLEYSAVDDWAHQRNIQTITKLDVRDFPDAELGILASYGELVPTEVLNHFPYGILVIHPSLLPKFRWASPVPATLITQTNPTGVTIFKMNKKWDSGPIVTQFKEDVLPNDTTESLRDRLFEKTTEVLIHAIPPYLKGKINPKQQDDTKASFARMLKKEDSFIEPKYLDAALNGLTLENSWEIPFIKESGKSYLLTPSPVSVFNFIRAMDPWPKAWTVVKLGRIEGDKDYKRLVIHKAHLDEVNKTLVVDTVQLEGKNSVTWEEFKLGYPKFSFSK